MKLLSPAPDLFIRTEHTREGGKKKRKCKSREQKRCVSISYRPPVDDHHQRQGGVEAALLERVCAVELNLTAPISRPFKEQESGLRLLQRFIFSSSSSSPCKRLCNRRGRRVLSLASLPPLQLWDHLKVLKNTGQWGSCEVLETVMSRSFGGPQRTFPGE